jgi:hypothetical protein
MAGAPSHRQTPSDAAKRAELLANLFDFFALHVIRRALGAKFRLRRRQHSCRHCHHRAEHVVVAALHARVDELTAIAERVDEARPVSCRRRETPGLPDRDRTNPLRAARRRPARARCALPLSSPRPRATCANRMQMRDEGFSRYASSRCACAARPIGALHRELGEHDLGLAVSRGAAQRTCACVRRALRALRRTRGRDTRGRAPGAGRFPRRLRGWPPRARPCLRPRASARRVAAAGANCRRHAEGLLRHVSRLVGVALALELCALRRHQHRTAALGDLVFELLALVAEYRVLSSAFSQSACLHGEVECVLERPRRGLRRFQRGLCVRARRNVRSPRFKAAAIRPLRPRTSVSSCCSMPA